LVLFFPAVEATQQLSAKASFTISFARPEESWRDSINSRASDWTALIYLDMLYHCVLTFVRMLGNPERIMFLTDSKKKRSFVSLE
jgi:hypothetical protein